MASSASVSRSYPAVCSLCDSGSPGCVQPRSPGFWSSASVGRAATTPRSCCLAGDARADAAGARRTLSARSLSRRGSVAVPGTAPGFSRGRRAGGRPARGRPVDSGSRSGTFPELWAKLLFIARIFMSKLSGFSQCEKSLCLYLQISEDFKLEGA